jgi:hypothetical protein
MLHQSTSYIICKLTKNGQNMSFEEDLAHGEGSGLPSNAQPDYQNRSGGGTEYVLPPPFSRSCNIVNEYTTKRTHGSSVHAKNDHCIWRHHIVCNSVNHSHNSVTSQNTQLQNCRNFKSCILWTFLTACSVICWCHHSQWCTHLHTLCIGYCNFTSTRVAMKNVLNLQLTQII